MVALSTSHRTEKQELHSMHQLINWSVAVDPCYLLKVIPLYYQRESLQAQSCLFKLSTCYLAYGLHLTVMVAISANHTQRFFNDSPTSLREQPFLHLSSIFLGFAPTFLLLSIGYEAVFYCALSLVLVAWILLGNATLHLSKMVLFNVAFFGMGNFASIASFEISSVYRFITVFSPFLMAALLIFKPFIPFMLVICTFSAITKLLQVPRLGCYFLVILFSDVMTNHFFFLVRYTGSWMEIGNSISHGIMSAQVVFVLFLFALTNQQIYQKGVVCSAALICKTMSFCFPTASFYPSSGLYKVVSSLSSIVFQWLLSVARKSPQDCNGDIDNERMENSTNQSTLGNDTNQQSENCCRNRLCCSHELLKDGETNSHAKKVQNIMMRKASFKFS